MIARILKTGSASIGVPGVFPAFGVCLDLGLDLGLDFYFTAAFFFFFEPILKDITNDIKITPLVNPEN